MPFKTFPLASILLNQILDREFPGSKFILTVRNSDDEWYQSMIRFYRKIMKVNRIPKAEDVKKFPYSYKGFLWSMHKYNFGIDESTLFNEKIYKNHYNRHNDEVKKYFRRRPDDLLVLNLSDPNSMKSLCEFLDIKYTNQKIPHINKS